jgi:hypothetical protein
VASSDNTRDVFRAVAPSFHVNWPDCPYERYVGLNSPPGDYYVPGFVPVYAPVLGWRDELRVQLLQLREEFVLLWLDDFVILRPVVTEEVERLRVLAATNALDYLRLVEVDRQLIVRLASRVSGLLSGRRYNQVPSRIPYYSSLQATIWRRDHLIEMLHRYVGRDIWGFEHQKVPGRTHFAILGKPPIRYKHLVEKGRWLPDAARVLQSIGLVPQPSVRPTWPGRYRMLHLLYRMRIPLLGYFGFGVRSRVRNLRAILRLMRRQPNIQ